MKPQSIIALFILTLCGAALRLYKLDFQCLWTEELFTLGMSKLSTLDIITTFDFNPPVYYLCAHVAWILTGDVYSIRYPAAICGILLIPAMYYLGRTYKDELTGLYCAGFTTILFPLIYYAQYGRAYEMSVLCFCVALILYVKVKRGESLEIWFAIIAALNIWVHLFAIIPISLMLVDLLLDNIRNKKWVGVIVGISILPFIMVFLEILKSRSTSVVSYGADAIQMIILTPLELFNTLFLNIIVLSGVGLWVDGDKLKSNLAGIAIITIAIGIVCSIFTSFFPRYYMTVSLIFLLMSSMACVNLTERFGKWQIVIFIAIMIIFSWMVAPNFDSHYTIMQYVC